MNLFRASITVAAILALCPQEQPEAPPIGASRCASYLDDSQLAEREPANVFRDLAGAPGVEIRMKHKPGAPMQ
jgi:hypothetical protein